MEVQQQSSSRQRLEQFKSRAKRSLTESLEGIWKVTMLFLPWFVCSYAQVCTCVGECCCCFSFHIETFNIETYVEILGIIFIDDQSLQLKIEIVFHKMRLVCDL